MQIVRGHEGKARPRILLVDDTEINRNIIGGILSAADFDVDYACNGEAAYEATWGTPYDLVLMDVEMPGMNGFEAAARIRAREGVMAGVTIAALTATIQPDARHFSFWSGIDEFITRPIAPGVLVHRVSQIITARRSGTNDWKPVWRLGIFAKFTERLDEEETDSYLRHVKTLLDSVSASIDGGTSGTQEFAFAVHDLADLAALLGFEEVAGVCQFYKEATSLKDCRNRDPNLLGAVNRALYAIESYRQDRQVTVLSSLWARARTNVQNLFRGRESTDSVN